MPNCKGLILYDFNDNTYDMNYGVFEALPTLHINNSIGEKINASLNDYNISYHINQQWTESIESYNVIGQINGTNPNKTIIISCLYDGWWNQATGDSAIGMAIVLAIAKYMKENNITPKYNLKFIAFGGEEYGMRGAYYYEAKHRNENIPLVIDLNQLGFTQTNPRLTFIIFLSNQSLNSALQAITNETNYRERTGNVTDGVNITYSRTGGPVNARAFATANLSGVRNCSTMCFAKDSKWLLHHRSGLNHTEGDSMKYYNSSDVNLSAEIVWNVTKYFCVNPDCWFTNVSYETIDTPNDGDTLVDSIKATFTLNTVLPYDKVMVEVYYRIHGNPESSDIYHTSENYTINSTDRQQEIIFPIPNSATKGNYSLKLKLYNSTGRINEIVGIGTDNYNDTSTSSVFQLYHSLGHSQKGSLSKNAAGNISGSVFTANEYGHADNITAYIFAPDSNPPLNTKAKCMIYQENNSTLIGVSQEKNVSGTPMGGEWMVFLFDQKPMLYKDVEYVLTYWSNGSYLYYDEFQYPIGRYNETIYDDQPPENITFTNESRLYSIYCSYTPDNIGPEITSVTSNPSIVGFGMNTTISVNVTDISGVDIVKVHIIPPEIWGEKPNCTMINTDGSVYEYVFNNTWKTGEYNFTIWALDNLGNSNTSEVFSFNVSAQAAVSVCTVKDEYGKKEYVNVTDPSSNQPLIGYELLDDNKVLCVWNRFDSYYFNTSNGMQFTNHFDKFWSHNVLMLGYYSNDQWNLVYRVDELSGFNKNVVYDNESFVNVTLWKDLNYQGYNFRLAIRYYLGVDDNELTVIPYIKNLGQAIPYTLGFAWEINNIQVDMTPENDYIEINGISYLLNNSLDETYTDLDLPQFYIREDFMGSKSESLYLRWDENLDYKVKVKSRVGQYNALVTLGIKIGTLGVNQEKYTSLFWHDASEVVYYYNTYKLEGWQYYPDLMIDEDGGTFAFETNVNVVEFLFENTCSGEDLGTISKVEIRAYGFYDWGAGDNDIILTPVFNSDDGDDHEFNCGVYPQWSVWFDITSDTNAPKSWSWEDVQALHCNVISDDDSEEFTLYCDMVQIRVTYFNSNLMISNPYPPSRSTGVCLTPVLSITVEIGEGEMDITWLSNSSGSWEVFGTNNSVTSGTFYQIFSNATFNGLWWYWRVNVTDGMGYNESDVFSFFTGYESKIVNTGSTNISGYLLMQVDFLEGEEWVLDSVVVDESSARVISGGGVLGLDTVFNGLLSTDDLRHGSGIYRVYACFRDPDGDILVCDNETLLEASYEFDVAFS